MAVPEPNKTAKVAIIGAGLTGLLTAHGLKKQGFEVVVFEQDAGLDVRSRDWTIVLHWALPTFKKLLPEDIVARLPTAICNPHLDFDADVESLPCANGKTGEILFRSPMPGSRRISRQRLRRLIAEGIDVQWGKRLEGIASDASGVTLTFKDGTVVGADYVLGTDGAGSKLRELLFHGDDKAKVVPSGYYFATCIIKHNDAERVDAVVKSHPVATILMGTESVGGIGVMYVDKPADKSTWTTFWVKIWRRGAFPEPPTSQGAEALAYLKATTTNLVEPFQSQLDWAPEDGSTITFIDEMKTWTPVLPFDTHGSRVTLAGDAAHPMLVYRGQGFQHAVVDANNYVDALTKLSPSASQEERETVFTAFNEEMVERGAKAVIQSLKEAELSMDLDSVKKMIMARQGHGKSA